jgi:hypothetical protein
MPLDKDKNPLYILNPTTQRYVLKSGAIGKSILNQTSSPSKPTPVKKNKPSTRINPLFPRPIQNPKMSIWILDPLGQWQVLPLGLFIDGIKKVRSVLLDAHPDKEPVINRTCLTYLVAASLLLKKEKSVVLESVRGTKWMTFSNKLNSSNTTIQDMNWSPILARVLTGINRDLYPYWNPSYKELSQKLWLPALTDSHGSQSTCYNNCLESVNANSWFTIKTTQPLPPLELNNNDSLKMSSTSCMSTLAESMGEDGIVKLPLTPLVHTRRIRIYPSKSISNVLRTWIAGTNCIFNKTVYFQSHCLPEQKNMSEFSLREKFVNESLVVRSNRPILNQGMFMGQFVHGGQVLIDGRTGNRKLKGPILHTTPNPDLNPWVAKLPKVIRAGAVKDYCEGRKAAFSNLKAGNIRFFRMNYRKKGDNRFPALHLEKHVESISDGKYIKMFPAILKQSNIKNPLILINKHDRSFIETHVGKKPKYDLKLKFEYGQWFILVTYDKTINDINKERGMCGIDPGIRTPLSIYDGDKLVSMSYDKTIHDRLQLRLNLMQCRETIVSF